MDISPIAANRNPGLGNPGLGNHGSGNPGLGYTRSGNTGLGNTNSVNPISLAERRLLWLDRRQGVLAQNIANADTPGYRPQDVAPFARLLADAAGPDLAITNPRHIAPQGGALRGRVDRTAVERTPNGNGVSLDEQALRIAETDTQHNLAMGLHRKYLALFRTALGRNS